LLFLSRSMAQSDLAQPTQRDDSSSIEAERWLEAAAGLDTTNRGAWRGLGFVLANLGQEGDAVAAWRTAQATAAEFIWRGGVERAAQQFDKALEWYQRAVAIQPELSDGWYYEGLAYQGLDDWDAARRAYQQAVQIARFDRISRSSLYYRLAMAYRLHSQPPLVDEALDAFTTAINLNDFNSVYEAADSHYQRGTISEQTDESLALRDYHRALEIDPQHSWAHLVLGRLLYRTTKDVLQAEAEMNQALTLWPDNATRKWPYRFLGDMYREAGMIAKAEMAYRQALSWDPQDAQVKSSLSKLNQHD